MAAPDILKELLLVEALADQLKRQSYKTRKMIEGDVSTPPKHQKGGVTEEQLAEVVAKREKRLLKRRL